MKLRIEEMRYENIREFGSLQLDFTKDGGNDSYHISLVQMPNGTGKTTTMELIRHLILEADLEEQEVMEYEPEFGASEGQFTIGFAYADERFRIHMDLDYDIGTVNYRHSYPQREGGGMNQGHFLPTAIEDTLTEAFVDLFVFNGELTQEFIETGEDKAESALKIVNRLDRVEQQSDRIERIVEKRQKQKGAKTEQGLKQNQTELRKRRKKLQALQKKCDKLEGDIEDHNKNIEEDKNERKEIIAGNEEALKKFKQYNEDIARLEKELDNKASDLLGDMRRPSKLSEDFAEDFEELLTHMTVLKLPKSTSEEFFNELAEGDSCICGRGLDEQHREAIRRNAQEYLSDEDIGVLNTLKERLRDTAEPIDFEVRLNKLQQKRTELKQTEMNLDQLDLDDPELEAKKQELTEKIESEKTERDNKQKKIEYLTTDDKRKREQYNLSWKKNIPEAKREVSKYEQKIEQATDTVTLSKRADKLEKIFDKFVRRCLDDLKRRQIQETNERLSQILKLSEVQIKSIDESIKLKNRSGASEGQSLAVAYAYLSTLFEDSQVDVPFIVDSPAVSLDHKVRQEVASTISGLFDQLITFVISTEKEGFVESLGPIRGGDESDVQYYTIHKTDQPGEVENHTNKEYFMTFTSEEEDS